MPPLLAPEAYRCSSTYQNRVSTANIAVKGNRRRTSITGYGGTAPGNYFGFVVRWHTRESGSRAVARSDQAALFQSLYHIAIFMHRLRGPLRSGASESGDIYRTNSGESDLQGPHYARTDHTGAYRLGRPSAV